MTDVLLLFGNQLGFAARKVRVAAEIVEVHVDLVSVMRGSTDLSFRAVSPAGIIPALKHGETNVLGSFAIIDYLQGISGTSMLIPSELRPRARTLSINNIVDGPLARMTSIVFQNSVLMPRFQGKPGNAKVVKRLTQGGLPKILSLLDKELLTQPGDVDIASIGIFSQVLCIPLCGIDIPWGNYPNIVRICKAILSYGGVYDLVQRDFLLSGSDIRSLTEMIKEPV